jgi:hypothetical protein
LAQLKVAFREVEKLLGKLMTHGKTLIGTITDKAKASFGEINIQNDPEGWEKHWLATARLWRDELQTEGLSETVEALNKTIAFFEKVGGSD